MKQIRQTATCILFMSLLSASQMAMAHSFNSGSIYETAVYRIINESSLPINYGFSAVFDTLEQGYHAHGADGVDSFKIKYGDGQPTADTTHGIHGLLLPDTNGPTAITMTVTGGYYGNDANGFHSSGDRFNGMYYTLQFAWNGNTATLFYKGIYNYTDMDFNLYFKNALALTKSPPPSSVIGCLSNPPNVKDQKVNGRYTEESTITFFNKGSQPKDCVSKLRVQDQTNAGVGS